MTISAFAISVLLTLAFEEHNQDAIDFFESYEESCLGWDGEAQLARVEALGICEYFAREAQFGRSG